MLQARATAQAVVARITTVAKAGLLRLLLHFWPAHDIEGFSFVDLAADGEQSLVHKQKIHQSLQLIRQRDSRRFARMQRDVARFLVVGVSGPEYLHAIRACMLSSHHVVSATVEELALTIVHEATHARLCSSRIPYSVALRERVERLCVREEVAFASGLENRAQLTKDAMAKLATHWWTKEAEYQRRLQQLRELGQPQWFQRAFAWFWRPN